MDDAAKTEEELRAELAQMRARLRSVEAHYRALFAAHSDAVLVFDFDTGLGLEQSPRARKLFGYSDEELRALKPRDLTAPSQRADVAMLSAQLHALGRARRPRLRLRRKDGSELWGDVSAFVFESDGRKRHLNVIRDVTAAVEHEERMRQQRELLQSVLDHIPVMLLLFDDSGRARFLNREAERVLGWTLDEWQEGDVIGACFPDPEVQARIRELVRKTRWSWPSRWLDLAARSRFGHPLDTSWYGVPLPSGDTLLAGQDVTERQNAAREAHLLEDRLRRKQKLESLGTLAAGVAHEINNPLTWLMGNVECLQGFIGDHGDVLAGELSEELGEIALEMRDGAERIRRIVAGLKPFTRPDEERFGPVDLIRVLDTAVDVAGNEIRHRARLVREIRKAPAVYGNEARLTQLFVNLLVNAAQAIAHGHAADNRIRIATRVDPEQRVCVVVEDTGVGIPSAVLDRVFEPFFTTRAPERTGLGLSICHSIAESCGGELEVSSTPGKGTRVLVYLPVSAEPLPERAPEPAAEVATRPARVLVVDDEPNICQIICRALREHQVTAAWSGREALARLAEDEYDVVLCDVMMPDLSGIDVFAELYESRPAQARRVVFMSGGAFTEDARAFLARTENPILQKPVNLTDLRSLVAEMMAAPPAADEHAYDDPQDARPRAVERAATEPIRHER